MKIPYGPARCDLKTFCRRINSNFSFEMRDEREHSDSEFYYPGEVSDEEFLEQPTYFDRE